MHAGRAEDADGDGTALVGEDGRVAELREDGGAEPDEAAARSRPASTRSGKALAEERAQRLAVTRELEALPAAAAPRGRRRRRAPERAEPRRSPPSVVASAEPDSARG